MSLRIAVTGPTGEIGISTIEALERRPEVSQIIGMARRPLDPSAQGWSKTVYQQGDILDSVALVTSEVIARLPSVPSALEWLYTGRTSVVMDTAKAKSSLGWLPNFTVADTLSALTEAAP